MTRKYYYGDGTDHVVELTEEQANAILNCQIIGDVIYGEDGSFYVKTNLTDEELVHYNAGSGILNAYLQDHKVYWTDTEVPMLRPV